MNQARPVMSSAMFLPFVALQIGQWINNTGSNLLWFLTCGKRQETSAEQNIFGFHGPHLPRMWLFGLYKLFQSGILVEKEMKNICRKPIWPYSLFTMVSSKAWNLINPLNVSKPYSLCSSKRLALWQFLLSLSTSCRWELSLLSCFKPPVHRGALHCFQLFLPCSFFLHVPANPPPLCPWAGEFWVKGRVTGEDRWVSELLQRGQQPAPLLTARCDLHVAVRRVFWWLLLVLAVWHVQEDLDWRRLWRLRSITVLHTSVVRQIRFLPKNVQQNWSFYVLSCYWGNSSHVFKWHWAPFRVKNGSAERAQCKYRKSLEINQIPFCAWKLPLIPLIMTIGLFIYWKTEMRR